MKIKIYQIILIAFILFTCISSCDEDKILEEIPLDFENPENSYVTKSDFQMAINYLYSQGRDILSGGEYRQINYICGTDLGYNANLLNELYVSYPVTLTPTNAREVLEPWQMYYKLISTANIILGRIENVDLSSDDKNSIKAEALIFRGLAYRNLAHLYGGVPLLTEEVAEAKADFTRATRTETYQQAITDLEFAAQYLPHIDKVNDGKVSNIAASHILAECYVSLERWDDAIAAASEVINDPNTVLMSTRFGSQTNEEGDVYWDLFRVNNQNRSSGNTEAIWVWQQELDVPGGVLSSTKKETKSCQMERNCSPRPWNFTYKDTKGIKPFLALGVSDYTGGRGIGRFRGTEHFLYKIWQSDWNDMRNSNYNIVRDVKFNNPESQWYGHWLSEHKAMFRITLIDTLKNWYPYPSKVTTPGQHPDGLYIDPVLKTLNSATAGSTYSDQYHIRLAETYLLRAEAYLGKGDIVNAARDINVVRSRANAPLVSPADVNIDYILDERLRELNVEEKRRMTLSRLNMLYERTKRYCNNVPGLFNFGADIEPYHNLLPIPYSEIESNTGAVLEQNPGYSSQ